MYTVTPQDVDQFIWNFPPGWQIIGNSNNDTVQVRTGSTSGNIGVSGSNICGMSGQLSFSVSPQLLPVVFDISGNQFPCMGDIVNYIANGLNVSDYQWSLPADWTIEGNPNQSSIMVHVGALDGEISVTGSNICGTTQSQIPLFVSVQTLPTIQLLSGDVTPCPHDTVSYEFLSDFGSFIIFAPDGLDDWIFLPSLPGTHFIAGHASGVFHIAAANDCGLTPLDLHLDPLDVPHPIDIINDDNKLYPSSTGVSYQWFLNGIPITGATQDTLIVTVSGAYTVLVTFDNGCSELSEQVDVVISGIFNPSSISSLEVYPVPASDELFIKGIDREFTYTIIDLLGKKILANHSDVTKIRVGDLSQGVYVLRIEFEGKSYVTRFIVGRFD